MLRFTGIIVLAFIAKASDKEMREMQHELMDRLEYMSQAQHLNNSDLDDTALAKAWAPFQHSVQTLGWQPFKVGGQVPSKHVVPFEQGVFGTNDRSPFAIPLPPMPNTLKEFKKNPTAWQPHALFPYRIPEALKSKFQARSRGYGSGHKRKLHRRFPWAQAYAPVFSSPEQPYAADPETERAAHAAAVQAARQVMEQGVAGGAAYAADVAEAAATRVREAAKAAATAAAAAATPAALASNDTMARGISFLNDHGLH